MTLLQQMAQLICSIDQEYELASITSYTVAIQTMDAVYNEHSKSFASNIDHLIALTQGILLETANIQVVEKTMMFDFVVNTVQEYPRLLRKKKERATKLFKIALEMMAQVAEEVNSAWLNPPAGFNPEDSCADDEDSNGRAVMSKVDQLSQTIGFSETVLHLQPLFLQYIQSKINWKYEYAALMVGSQIAIEEASAQNLALFVQWAFKQTQNKHPKVRYAALHLLGQYSDDLKPDFQDLYYQPFVQYTTKLLVDPVSRVVAHTFACATNFFEECKDLWKIENCLGHYLNPIVSSIKGGNTWEKQNAISILSSFGMTEDAFGPNLPNIFDLALEIVRNLGGQEGFMQVVNQTFQLLSILLAYQKKQYTEKYVKETVALLFAQKDHMSKEYFLQAWNRLCKEYEDLTDLNVTYPILLQTVENMKLNHSDDECAAGLKSLTATFQCYKVKASPFVEQTIQKAMEIFENIAYSIKFREEAVILMQTAITATKPNIPEGLSNWYSSAQQLLTYICTKINESISQDTVLEEEQSDIEDLPFLFPALKELISSVSSLLTSANLLAIAHKVIQFTMGIEKHYNLTCELKEHINENEAEDNEIESGQGALTGANDTIDDLQTAIDVIPDIVKDLIGAAGEPTTKQQLLELIQKEIQRAIGKDNFMILYAINMSVSMVETLSYEQIMHSWGKLAEIYLHFTEHGQSRIRNGGVYGLNLLIQKTPKGLFTKDQIRQFLQKLSDSFTKPFQNVKQKFYVNHCKDNIISTLGSLLKYYSADYPDVLNSSIFGYWFSNLPLNVDKTQGNVQQELLIQILGSNPGLLVKDVEDVKRVCQIYAKFVMKRKEREFREVVQKTRSSLMQIKQWSLFKQSTDYLWNGLSNSHRSILTQLING